MTVKAQTQGADPLQVTMAAPLPDLARGQAPVEPAPRAASPGAAEVAEHASVVVALLLLVGPVAYSEGGRGPGAASWLALAAAAALLGTRPWQRLTGGGWLLAPLVALAAMFVVPATGGGRAAAVAFVGYAAAGALLLAVAAYARTPARRAGVAAVLAAGGVAQFGWALVPWWGGREPWQPMVGTYFWHNQLAVALLLPALLGLALAIGGERPWRSAGWIAAPVCAAGVVLSTSRATGACLVGGWLAVAALAVATSHQRRAALGRALAITVAALALTVLLPGPPLFDTRVSPLSGAMARAASGQSVDANTAYRTQFWREAVSVTEHQPWAGAGYGRLVRASAPLTPASWAHSPLAHSGPLQAFADGGLPLGLSVLAGLALVCVALLRRLWTGVRAALARPRADGPGARSGAGSDAALSLAATVASIALLVHALVDIDWTYPALTAQFAAVVGLALAGRPGAVGAALSAARDGRALRAAIGSAVLVLVLAVGAAAAWGQSFHISAPQTVTGGVHQ